MKNAFLILALVSIAFTSVGQPHPNAWIDYSQRHYKIPIWETGVYRITFNDLAGAGIPVSALDPSKIRMYAFSEEIPIYVHGADDGVFNADDYIEFVGRKNDGRLEAGLYPAPEARPNPEYSLFNDTLNHYLTWGGAGSGLRFAPQSAANPDDYTAEEFLWYRSKVIYSNNYYQGPMDASGISNPFYGEGEGWMSQRIGFPGGSATLDTQVPTEEAYLGDDAPDVEVETVSAGVSNAAAGGGHNHHILVRYGAENTVAVDEQFAGYRMNRFNFTFPASKLGATTTRIRHEVSNSLGVASDYQAVAGVWLTYARSTDLGGQSALTFLYRHNPFSAVRRFDFLGVGGDNPVIYSMGSTGRRIEAEPYGQGYRALVSNSFGDDEFECLLVTDQSIRSISSIEAVANDGYFTNFGLAGVDSAFLIITHKSLLASAQQYQTYRQQRFNTVMVTVDELYDQFAGGVEKSPLAIRNFVDYLFDTWPTPPRYLLLLGKSIRDAPEGNQAGFRRSPDNYARNLVPTMGYPPSDLLLTAGLNNTVLDPAVATGRISARNDQEVLWYLDKLMTFESQSHAAWMKNVLHFGGGGNTEEQNRFANYLAGYEETITDSAFGGVVHTFLKSGSEPIQINASQEIEDLINGGNSLMTFFGHASSDGFDQTIDNPANFDWNGRYPFLLGNGCYTGDFHTPGYGTSSEVYTLIPEKGVIGFLSSVKLGFASSLNDYSSRFYKYLALKNYGGTVGDHMRYTVQEIQSSFDPDNLYVIVTCIGITLQGDPAVVVNSFPKPDLSVSPDDVYFVPENITADIDSFDVHVVVTNTAKATGQTFGVTLEHFSPDGSADSLYVAYLHGLFHRDTVRFRLPVNPQHGLGLHKFNVLVDLPEDLVEEMPGHEVNNNRVLGKELLIAPGGLVPVHPERFGVVSDAPVLRASTGNPLSPESTYRLELDTTDSFNSPFFQSTEIVQPGGVVEWSPTLSGGDSAVYYWRTAELKEDTVWRNSSFQVIPGRSGWGQAHIFQFEDNAFQSTEFNRAGRRVDYFTGTVRLTNNVIGNSAALNNEILLNTNVLEYGACFAIPSVHLAVVDPVTFEPWGTAYNGENPDHDFGNANDNGACRNRVENYFIFRQNQPDQMQALADLLLSDIIPDGHYVVLYTLRYVSYDDWDLTPDIYDAFSALGATSIGATAAQDSVPFSLIVRKGDPGFVFEMVGDHIGAVLNNIVDIPASGTRGRMLSTPIGPAKEWHSLHWLTKALEAAPGDSGFVRIRGIAPNGVETVLAEAEYPLGEYDLDAADIGLSADQHPRVRFEISSGDETHATPPQVRRWHALYDKVPELAVNPARHYVFESSEMAEGKLGMISVAVENISDVDADSLLVAYYIEGEDRGRTVLSYPRQDSLRAGEVLIDTVYFDTRGLGGGNTLWVEVNPQTDTPGVFDQPEQTRFNNYLRIPFTVEVDEENPVLDVTFDGIHIINGEVVSPNPEIVISLRDENPYLFMDQEADTSLFRVFLARPDENLTRVYFSGGDGTQPMEFVPATGSENKAKIIFRPALEVDGTYRLRVQAGDVSGNPSANTEDYAIEFEIINRSTITEVLNYPNPFTTSTRFVFTLTGREIPDDFTIRIMTVTGRVVREITAAEFGPIRIGRNVSAFSWDGRDEFGDRLANGVYLYRVYARIDGKPIELREGGASKYFHNGLGKMVLMR